ncbi:MAG: hypothetical protein A2418_00885 [Candidatus Brennerbacteria bacterium RIFOXYC1_FULL_41_11]|nr:MAG: hypothetical protein A2391_03320 [Candidatus Brennerbacteria bacterium RIFOXYB1_FULL_41_13]OGY38857.1 MAG: hypothetical protein A2418_00885 [Candidatus Brennerbacteria bacterium RIFOXYC1_FULL_41_11]
MTEAKPGINFEKIAEELEKISGAEELIKTTIVLYLEYHPETGFSAWLKQLRDSFYAVELAEKFLQIIGLYPRVRIEEMIVASEKVIELLYREND